MTAEAQIPEREENPRSSFLMRVFSYLCQDICSHLDENLCCTRKNRMPCTMYSRFNDCKVYQESWQFRQETNKILAEIQEAYNNQRK